MVKSKPKGKERIKKRKSHDDLARKQIAQRSCKGIRSGSRRKRVSVDEKEEMLGRSKQFVEIVKEANCLVTDPTTPQLKEVFKKLGCPDKQCLLNMLNNAFKRKTPKPPSRVMSSYNHPDEDDFVKTIYLPHLLSINQWGATIVNAIYET